MQKIERYGVIALVVLLVTILAVSLWGEGSSWKFWEKKDAETTADATRRGPRPYVPPGAVTNDPNALPLSEPQPMLTPIATPALGEGEVAPIATPGLNGTQPLGSDILGAPLVRQDPQLTPPIGTSSVVTPPVVTPPVERPVLRPTPPNVGGARTYTVKNGDTLGGIASRELGSSKRWTEIQSLNGNLKPEALRVGMTLNLPAGSGTVARESSRKENPPAKAAKGRTYVVKNGDSLSRIASRELGSAGRWTEIRDMNPGVNPNVLKVGTSIVLPATTVAAASKKEDVVGWGPRSAGKSAVQ